MKHIFQSIVILSAVLGLMSGCASSNKKPANNTTQASTSTKSATHKGTSASAMPEKISCSRNDETRVLEIVKKDNGCSLDYTKAGKTSSVSSSSKGIQHCIDSQKKIRGKLEAAGYKCG